MELRNLVAAATVAVGALMSAPLSGSAEPAVKVLTVPADPAAGAVLVGRVTSGTLVFQLEIEGAEDMWMLMDPMMGMGTPQWGVDHPGPDVRFHVEFKLTDTKTGTRVPYSRITFDAVNTTTGKKLTTVLPPMWGSSGLHYSANSALAGDGVYTATITADVPMFAREMDDKDLWSKPTSANFRFKLVSGKLTEVMVVD